MFRIRTGLAALAAALAMPAAHAAHEEPATRSEKAAVVLAEPPRTGTERFVYISTGGRHGEITRWTAPDGTRWSRDTLLIRGFSYAGDSQVRYAPDGYISEVITRGTSTNGSLAETYRVEDGSFTYVSTVDRGEGEARPGLHYVTYSGMGDSSWLLVEALLKEPGRRLPIAPSGEVVLTPLTTLEVVNESGEVKTLQAYAMEGLNLSPRPVWVDGDKFFGTAGMMFSTVREGWESVAPQLLAAQDAALAERAPALLERLAPRHSGPVAFVNVRLYDADARLFRHAMTVVAEGGRVTQVGPVASIRPPEGATLIDGTGKTLVPGLWDAHQHFGLLGDTSGPFLLSLGVTSIRDPGNQPEASIERKRRIDEGQLLGPRIIPHMLIDGVGPFSAQVAVTVTDETSALATVRRARDMGFAGVKLYGSLDPALVAPIAREAHRLGLRVQGHVPRTMRPLDAIRAGYDELTHINFVMMQAMPDSVIAESNGLQRFYGPGRYAADVDLNSSEMRAFIAELADRGITVDPTLALFEMNFATEKHEFAPHNRPYIDVLPASIQRSYRGGWLSPTAEVTREQMRRSFEKLKELVPLLYRAGVPIVAGTDGTGFELIRDLELYVEAGLSPAEALATATIIPATQYGVATERGSIAVGKQSDLVLVDGDPSGRIGDLRQTDMVMLGDRLMDADDLRAAASLNGRPR